MGPNPIRLCPYKTGTEDAETHTGRMSHEDEGRDRGDAAETKERQNANKPPEAGEGPGAGPPSASDETDPATP